MQNAFDFFLFRSSGFESNSDLRDPDPLPSSWPSESRFGNRPPDCFCIPTMKVRSERAGCPLLVCGRLKRRWSWHYRCKSQRHYAGRERSAREYWKTFHQFKNSNHLGSGCRRTWKPSQLYNSKAVAVKTDPRTL